MLNPARHSSWTRRADRTIWLVGSLALGVGLAVYLVDRDGHAGASWFGAAGGWLPSLLHTLAFVLFSAALLPAGRASERAACAAWIAIGLLFEAGQHPALIAGTASALGGPIGDYFARGRFDPADAVATLAGGLLAADLLRRLRPWRGRSVRLRWQSLVLLVGLGSLVGTSGGTLGFPPCAEPYCTGTGPLAPLPMATVQPRQQIVAAGSSARFTVVVSGLSGTLSYRWRRSSDGGQTFTDVPGGSTDTLVLAAVQLADDKLSVAVEVTQADGRTAGGNARLLVNASPALVQEDTEFADVDWSAEPYVPPGGTPAVHDAAQVATGGNPGAWRRMHVTVPPNQAAVAVDHLSARAVHDPEIDGAIRVIDFTVQCVAAPSSEVTLLVEQGGRRYANLQASTCASGAWGEPIRHLVLGPDDLMLLGTEPCSAGQSCPDFSASGAPLRFGYRQLLLAQPGVTAEQGIDNWRVTIWRR